MLHEGGAFNQLSWNGRGLGGGQRRIPGGFGTSVKAWRRIPGGFGTSVLGALKKVNRAKKENQEDRTTFVRAGVREGRGCSED